MKMKSVTAGARAHDHRDLRNDARGDHVALEHLAIAAERGDAVLDAGAAGIEQADDRRAGAHRHVLDLDDLLRMGFRQRAAEHGEILGEGEDGAAVDGAKASDDAVAGDLGLVHAEVAGPVLDEHVELLERVAVHQQFHAFARGEFPTFMLRVDARLTAAGSRAGAARLELFDDVLHDDPSKLQQMTMMLTVGAFGNDMAPPAIAVLAAASSAADTSKWRMSSS